MFVTLEDKKTSIHAWEGGTLPLRTQINNNDSDAHAHCEAWSRRTERHNK